MTVNGKRTLISCAVALVSVICAAFGVDFGSTLQSVGIDPAQLTDAATTGASGWVNLVVAALAIVAAAIFRVIATHTIIGGKPLEPKPPAEDGTAGTGTSHLIIACLSVTIVLLLSACGTQPIQRPATPQTPKQALASAWLAHGTANRTITDLRRAQVIDADTFRRWAVELDHAESKLTTAEKLIAAGDITSARTWLDGANQILQTLQPLIQEKLDESQRAHGAPTSERGDEGGHGRADRGVEFAAIRPQPIGIALARAI